jgi:DNA repair protein RadA/Sms
VEDAAPASRAGLAARDAPVSIGEVSMHAAVARPTGLPELDRVLDGGLVPGSVTLLAGEPGLGKSTLLLQALGRMAERGARCLLVTAEESSAQVRMRAERLGALAPGLLVVSETSLPHVVAHVESVQPDVLALDSIQTVLDPDLPGAPGSVTQVRDCTYRLVQQAKERELATVLVGHVTKEGTLAGPRVLEHIVDTVLAFDGDRGHALRMLHALKHRFGSTHELGLFEMTEHGLDDVPDASSRFLLDRRAGAPGSAVAVVLEGTRPLLVEVQALVVPESLPPRRSAAGIDPARLAMLLAVLDQHGGVSTAKAEVYASVAGGLRITETGADLALALAVGSARRKQPVVAGTVAVGEVGLGGEVRAVAQLDRRLDEAARLGFTHALAPPSATPRPGLQVVPVHDVSEALARGLG